MTASVTSLKPNRAQLNAQPEIATVVAIDPQGRVEQINLLARNLQQDVLAQAKHITRATIGDSVLVQHTLQGWIVIAQLAGNDDSPAALMTDHDGHVKVNGAKSVTLSTEKGTIEVHNDGKIVLNATELNANSERDLTIAGWPIRLN